MSVDAGSVIEVMWVMIMNPIVGVRYKCTVCKNFDYCENCEKTLGEAHQHPFLKIRKPELTPVQIQCYVNQA